jgi:hypothetical protein
MPSWSWGSVSGNVITSETEYYDGLAHVLEAKVDLLNESIEYGQVIGGFVQVYGPLCPARIKAKNQMEWEIDFNPSSVRRELNPSNSDALPKVTAMISWDNTTYSEVLQEALVYLAPLKVHVTECRPRIILEGLILVHTSMANGEYNRWGRFMVYDDKIIWDELSKMDNNSHRQNIAFGAKITVLDVRYLIYKVNKQFDEASKEPLGERMARVKQYFDSTRKDRVITENDP